MGKRRLLLVAIVALSITSVVIGIWFTLGERPRQQSLQPLYFDFETAVSRTAPGFTLTDINGNAISLKGLRGKSVILFFNEGLTCYPCIRQLTALSFDDRLNNDKVISYSVVIDSLERWNEISEGKRFRPGLKVLFDPDGKVSQAYDTLDLPSVMDKGEHPGHTYFVVDNQGIVRFTFDDYSMGIRNEELVEELNKIE